MAASQEEEDCGGGGGGGGVGLEGVEASYRAALQRAQRAGRARLQVREGTMVEGFKLGLSWAAGVFSWRSSQSF